ncbi:DUF6046 domain-containing protein [Spirosoma lituiforme]
MSYTEKVKTTGVTMQCPVRLGFKKDGSDLWTIPLEPTVTVRLKKTIVRRNIAKAVGSGSVKEAWNMDDYDIRVSGLLQSSEIGKFPERELSKLKSFLTPMKSIVIRCQILDIFGVNLMAIESADFDHTAGLENQLYTFSGYSDQYFELT